MKQRRAQGGWAFGVMLLALAIVAFLARDALLPYFGSATRASAAGDARLPPAAQAPADATQAVPGPRAPVERARAVESIVKQQAAALGKRIDDAPR